MSSVQPSNFNNSIHIKPNVTSKNITVGVNANKYVKESKTWAEGTPEEVEELGGQNSSKGWAQSVEGLVQNFDAETATWTITTDSAVALATLEQQLKSISGYNASKTQVLKNVQGSLSWVEE